MRLSDIDIRDELPERTAIFCPPPTPNGGLHIGHVAGPYVRADMFARALRTVGKKADLVVGTDDHQSYVAVAASAEGIQPRQLALREGDRLTATLNGIGFDAALVYRPSLDQDHEARIRSLLDAVVNSPAVSRAEVETPWCPTCEISLYQAFAGGYCPSCAAACDGEICEECGHPNSARELRGLLCRVCGGEPLMRTESALLLDLRYLSEQVKQYLRGTQGSGGIRLLGDRLLAGGLDHYRISHRSQWGIALSPAGSADDTNEVIDAWAELALTQLDNMRRLGATGSSAVSFFGFDNSFYYAILLPALGFAANKGGLLPYGSVVNYFLHLDGTKISTSRNYAIWVDDLLDKAPADDIRLMLLRHAPEEAPGDCQAASFIDLDGDPLIASIQKWLTELPAGPVPGTGAWTIAHREFYRRIGSLTTSLDALLIPETFSARDYICQLEAFVSSALTFRAAEDRKRLLPGMSEEARTSVALEYLATKSLAAFLYPVMPELGGRIWAALGLKGTPIRERLQMFLPTGTTMNPVPMEARHPGEYNTGHVTEI
jgi:methionyl-tRNA synthetase